MSRILFAGAKVWDASGAAAFDGEVLIDGNRVAAVSRAPGKLPRTDCQVIDAKGRTLLPGMTEGHGHLSFENVKATEDLIIPPPEEHTLITMRVAKRMLDQGFTSVWGASEAKMRLGVAIRNEIDAGRLQGPRIRAGSPEISVTGSIGDESRTHYPRGGPSIIVDGPEEMRKFVRLCCREGCDNIKLDVSGDPFYPGTPAHTTPMSLEEVRMAADTAHAYGKRVNAHARSIGSIQICLQAGVDVLYHCEFSDDATLDALEAAKDRVVIAPSISLFHTMLHEASPWVTPEVARYMGIDKLIEESVKTHTALRKRGIRHVIGGDYGFAWSQNGTNARDIGFFVDYYGYTPTEALLCATRNGGAMMTMGTSEKLGQVKEGFLADLLLVDGDPTKDVSLMTKAERLVVIMKDGQLHKNATGDGT